jgi:hypothetical protein
MMKKSQFKDAHESINLAIQKILKNTKNITAMSFFSKMSFLKIGYHNSRSSFVIHLGITTNLSIEKIPVWLELDFKGSSCVLFFPDDYVNEMVYFIMELFDEDLKTPKKPEIISAKVFKECCKQWGAKEPYNVLSQKGIIGEIEAILLSVKKYEEQTIIGWNRDNLRDIQIEDGYGTEIIHIEAKAKSPSSHDVIISYQNQLEFLNNSPAVVLTITDILLSKNGSTLPEIVNQAIVKIKTMHLNSGALFEKHPVVEEILKSENKGRFKSKFEIGDSHIYEITENDTCDEIAKLPLPLGSKFSKWKLNPSDAKLKTFTF